MPYQVLLTLTASLGYLTIGLLRGWSSPGIPSMLAKSPHLVPSDDALTWASAAPSLGAFAGSVVAGPLLQRAGRRRALLLSAPAFAASWLVIGLAPTPFVLVAGRVLTGVAAGVVIPAAQVYVSECARPSVRGVLGSLPSLFMALGVLLAYSLGAAADWDHIAFAAAIFPTAMFLMLLPLPESPAWLRSRGRRRDADRAAEWLRLDRQIDSGEEGAKIRGAYNPGSLLRRPVLVPFGLVSAVLVLQQFSGIDTVLFYTVSIFEATGSHDIDDHLATVLVGAVQVVATACSLFVIDRFGRKPLLVFSGFFMAIPMAALGFYFYAHDRGLPVVRSLGLVPVFSLASFTAAFSLGFCNVPFLLMGELLPVAQRSVLSSLASAVNLAALFAVVKSYFGLKEAIGGEGVFWGYAAMSALACVFVALFIPETKGKSLDEIEELFEDKAQRRKERLEKGRVEKKESLLKKKEEVNGSAPVLPPACPEI